MRYSTSVIVNNINLQILHTKTYDQFIICDVMLQVNNIMRLISFTLNSYIKFPLQVNASVITLQHIVRYIFTFDTVYLADNTFT